MNRGKKKKTKRIQQSQSQSAEAALRDAKNKRDAAARMLLKRKVVFTSETCIGAEKGFYEAARSTIGPGWDRLMALNPLVAVALSVMEFGATAAVGRSVLSVIFFLAR